MTRTLKAVLAAGLFGSAVLVPSAAYADVNSLKESAVTPVKAGSAINVTAQFQVTPGTMPTQVAFGVVSSSAAVTATFVRVTSTSANLTGCVVSTTGNSVQCTWTNPTVGQRARISARLKINPSKTGATLTFPQTWFDATGASRPVGTPSTFSVTVTP